MAYILWWLEFFFFIEHEYLILVLYYYIYYFNIIYYIYIYNLLKQSLDYCWPNYILFLLIYYRRCQKISITKKCMPISMFEDQGKSLHKLVGVTSVSPIQNESLVWFLSTETTTFHLHIRSYCEVKYTWVNVKAASVRLFLSVSVCLASRMRNFFTTYYSQCSKL